MRLGFRLRFGFGGGFGPAPKCCASRFIELSSIMIDIEIFPLEGGGSIGNLHGEGRSRPCGRVVDRGIEWLGTSKKCARARRSCQPPFGAANSCPRA